MLLLTMLISIATANWVTLDDYVMKISTNAPTHPHHARTEPLVRTPMVPTLVTVLLVTKDVNVPLTPTIVLTVPV